MSEKLRDNLDRFDDIIDRLNIAWELQLPRLTRSETKAAQNERDHIARRCAARLRYLSDHTGEASTGGLVAEFEEAAQVMFSEWIWKPSQESGTIPSQKTTKSLLKADIEHGRRPRISPEMRQSLVQKLSSLIDDEYTLAKDSDDYRRTSSQAMSDASTKTIQANAAATTLISIPPYFHQRGNDKTDGNSSLDNATSNKRRKTSNPVQDDKRRKTQTSARTPIPAESLINDYFRNSKREPSLHPPRSSDPQANKYTPEITKDHQSSQKIQTLLTSFDSTTSPLQSVFSPVQDLSLSSSTRTSVNFDIDESQGYFPTQDVQEYLADESFTSALDIADTISAAPEFSFDDLCSTAPFKSCNPLPPTLNFWARWEIYRVAQSTELSPHVLFAAANDCLQDGCIRYDRLWKSLGASCKEKGKMLPAKSDVRSWMEESRTYEAADGKTVYFTFTLEYNQKPSSHLWRLVLNPIKVDKGNRIHRRFGADRHIVGFLNYYDKFSLPKWVTQRRDYDPEPAFDKISSWLATEIHNVADRQWRAFYLEPEKTKNRRQTTEAPRQKLSLFAIDGCDFTDSPSQSIRLPEPISIAQFIKWHIPLQENIHSTDLKLFSRFGLGLSKTLATVTLIPSQFRYRPDVEPVMNDGCALMSMSMAAQIWKKCGDGSDDVPSAFQGRHGGAKGLWIVDYRGNSLRSRSDVPWIEISESQLKIAPHPNDRPHADETQRTFEVLKWSSPCESGHLNIQLINILADRGISRSTLRQIVLADIEEYIEASRAAMKDPRQLQAWLQDYHRADRHERAVPFQDGLPEMREEEACFLVESGFDAENCEHLRQVMISLMTQRLNSYVEKLRIGVPCSTSTFCVSDPYQILEEDEVYLGFSKPRVNPKTGLQEVALNDMDVLLARNPAALASDIQKRKAVFKQELWHFKDVIVFPTKGSTPLASILSGGDYDGDTVTVIWDPEIVNSFENVEKPRLPSEDQCGLQRVSRKLTQVFKHLPPSQKDTDNFLTTCIAFNARPSRLGICTNEHEKLVYSGVKLSDPGAVLLASLAGYLVDASKQGFFQTESAWHTLRKTAQNGRKLLPLAYKSGIDLPRRWENNECVNIIDHLKYDVAMKRKEDVLTEFEKMLSHAMKYDQALSFPYQEQQKRARTTQDTERQEVARVMGELKKQLDLVIDEWQKRSGKRMKTGERSNFSVDIHFISAMIRDIAPLRSNCDIYRDFIRERDEKINANNPYGKGSRWSLLRASAMYKLYPRSKITWWAVGDELGRIKARSIGATREIIPDRHHVLKADSRCIKRWVEQTADNNGNESDE